MHLKEVRRNDAPYLLEQKKGFVPKAFHKEGIGDVDIIWGDQDYSNGVGRGLEHIIDGRNRKNHIDGEAFVRSLPVTFKNGVVNKKPNVMDKVYLEDSLNKTVISNKWIRDKEDNIYKDRNWLMTGYRQNKSDSNRVAEQMANSTQINHQVNQAPPPFDDWLQKFRQKRFGK